jgi:rhodanese-related sulfurtransferase
MRHLTPQAAWQLLQSAPDTLFVDVRMEIESLYVGRPPGAIHIAWYEYPDLAADPAAFVPSNARLAAWTGP